MGECLLDTYIVFGMEGNYTLCLMGECLLDIYIVFGMEGNYCALWVSVY